MEGKTSPSTASPSSVPPSLHASAASSIFSIRPPQPRENVLGISFKPYSPESGPAPAPCTTCESTRSSMFRAPCMSQRRLALIFCVSVLIVLLVALILLFMFWRSQTGIVYKEPAESCKDSPVRCNGVVDCSQRSDELGCVRFGADQSLLHVYSSTESQWLPVCSSAWNESFSRKTCRQLGFQNASQTEYVPLHVAGKSLTVTNERDTIQQSLNSSQCLTGKYVSLRCTTCGQRILGRIIGGKETSVSKWPWQVSVQYGFCSRLTHPSLLAWFSSRLPPAQVRPACLPMHGQRFQTGRSCFITGFGKTRENEENTSPKLREAEVKLIDYKICNSDKVYEGYLTPRMMCAGYLQGGKDACQCAARGTVPDR
eukprot:XP_027299938.1 transmembrane protease serine 13 [Anas platyrhynchos]